MDPRERARARRDAARVMAASGLLAVLASCGRAGRSRTSTDNEKTLRHGVAADAASAPAPAATARPGMVYVPAGVLLAGTPVDRAPRIADEELPGTPVEMGAFYIESAPVPRRVGGHRDHERHARGGGEPLRGQGEATLHGARVGAGMQGAREHDVRGRRRLPRRDVRPRRDGRALGEAPDRRASGLCQRVRRPRAARRRLGVDRPAVGARGEEGPRRPEGGERDGGRARGTVRELARAGAHDEVACDGVPVLRGPAERGEDRTSSSRWGPPSSGA